MAFIMFSFGLIRSESVLGKFFLRYLSSSFRDAIQRISKSDTFFICSGVEFAFFHLVCNLKFASTTERRYGLRKKRITDHKIYEHCHLFVCTGGIGNLKCRPYPKSHFGCFLMCVFLEQCFSRVYSEAHLKNLTYVMLIAKGASKKIRLTQPNGLGPSIFIRDKKYPTYASFTVFAKSFELSKYSFKHFWFI